ncbi:MAG: DUF368 domain-containing protein [Clostridia bacterium]|nr:DUF368 domain-containing protein [Clostridia bacterium]
MKFNPIYTVGCGAWIGGTMTVPGVSGGSTAMILGIYDRLISSVNGVLKKDKRRESLIFLAFFMLGAGAGLVLFAKLISMALEHFPLPTGYFFLGTVIGGAPMIIRSANVKRFSPSVILYPLAGLIVALSIALIPEGLLELRDETIGDLLMSILIQLVGGVFIAIAIVLPGISFSQVLLVLGLHGPIMNALGNLDILALIGFLPLAVGTLVGVFLVTGVIEKAFSMHPTATYLVISGFILGSLPELLLEAGFPTGWNIPLCFFMAAAGFLAVFFISQREKMQ